MISSIISTWTAGIRVRAARDDDALKDSQACVVAAALIVEVVDEGTFLAVLEKDPDQTEPAGKRGVGLLHYLPVAPCKITEVPDPVADPQVKPLHHD